MEKINFTNGQAPAINAANLNQLQTNVDEAINGYVLYDNSEGANENLTLSDSSANYKYIEIFYGHKNWNVYSSTKIYQPNGKAVNLFLMTFNSSGMYLDAGCFEINGNSISSVGNQTGGEVALKNNNSIAYSSSTRPLYITRIVGYK